MKETFDIKSFSLESRKKFPASLTFYNAITGTWMLPRLLEYVRQPERHADCMRFFRCGMHLSEGTGTYVAG